MSNEWARPEHAAAYLARLEHIPHRVEGESTLLSEISPASRRILDLGCGNGHLLSLVLAHCPDATGVGIDFSPPMLHEARQRFRDDARTEFVEHDLDKCLPELGTFDCVVSSFAIHHCEDKRKRSIYAEVYDRLEVAGVFCNLEHVASPSTRIHDRFVREMEMTPEDEDPSNRLLDVETQLGWLREIGFEDVDCYWKWRELALLVGRRPAPPDVDPADPSAVDVQPAASPAEVDRIDRQLKAFNAQQTGRDDFQSLSLVIRDGQGAVVAGLKGLTGWNWLYIQVLWVDADLRRAGLGRRLLQAAEREAISRGCIGACLSTFSFQAPDFYQRCGYTRFGQISDYPPGQQLNFFSKRLDGNWAG